MPMSLAAYSFLSVDMWSDLMRRVGSGRYMAALETVVGGDKKISRCSPLFFVEGNVEFGGPQVRAL